MSCAGGMVQSSIPRNLEPIAIVNRVVPLLRPGAVVLLHDGDGSGCGASRAQTLAAIEPILTAADVLGLRSTTLGSLLGPPEVAPLGAFAL